MFQLKDEDSQARVTIKYNYVQFQEICPIRESSNYDNRKPKKLMKILLLTHLQWVKEIVFKKKMMPCLSQASPTVQSQITYENKGKNKMMDKNTVCCPTIYILMPEKT